jgi:hypothetical protein
MTTAFRPFLLLMAIGLTTWQQAYGQQPRKRHFIGINPSVTVEPTYESGELDINILPIVYQYSLTNRLDVRLTSILNYGIRQTDNRISHVGAELAFPIFLKQKESETEPSAGFYASPIVSLSRNEVSQQSNLGLWVEPGYHLLFDNQFAMTFGLQLGGTYFLNDQAVNTWGSHVGVKIIFGKWI